MNVTRGMRIATTGALVALAACGADSTGPVQNLVLTTQTFGAIGPSPGATDLSSPVAGSAAGTIQVTGTMALPNPCYDMSARVTPSGQYIMVEVDADAQAKTCGAVVSAVSYTLVVSGASSGLHVVSVTHVVNNKFTSTTNNAALVNVTVQ